MGVSLINLYKTPNLLPFEKELVYNKQWRQDSVIHTLASRRISRKSKCSCLLNASSSG